MVDGREAELLVVVVVLLLLVLLVGRGEDGDEEVEQHHGGAEEVEAWRGGGRAVQLICRRRERRTRALGDASLHGGASSAAVHFGSEAMMLAERLLDKFSSCFSYRF